MLQRGWFTARWRVVVPSCSLVLIGLAWMASASRPKYSFDEIKSLVAGKTAAEVTRILGPPETTRDAFGDAERWIWWNQTFLAGKNYPPEHRGSIVHLEIIVVKPPAAPESFPKEQWLVNDDGYGINYSGLNAKQ